jgi:integral membrane protein
MARVISLRTMRYVALAEATTFLALLVATYIKYSADAPTGVQILGPIHGALFVAYVLIALNLRPRAGWSTRVTLGVLLGAVVPFGGYAVDRWLSSPTPTKPAQRGA